MSALRWSDIDAADRSVRVERSVSATKTGGLFIKTTKTGCVRRVSLTAQAVDALYERRQRLAKDHGHQRPEAGTSADLL